MSMCLASTCLGHGLQTSIAELWLNQAGYCVLREGAFEMLRACAVVLLLNLNLVAAFTSSGLEASFVLGKPRCDSVGHHVPIVMMSTALHQVERLTRDVFELTCKELGPTHPDTLKALTKYSNLLVKMGRHEDAASEAELLEKEMLRTGVGTLAVRELLGHLLKKEDAGIEKPEPLSPLPLNENPKSKLYEYMAKLTKRTPKRGEISYLHLRQGDQWTATVRLEYNDSEYQGLACKSKKDAELSASAVALAELMRLSGEAKANSAKEAGRTVNRGSRNARGRAVQKGAGRR